MGWLFELKRKHEILHSMRREDNGRRSLLFQLRHAGWWWYAKAGGQYDNHATLYDAAGAELGRIRTKERMKGQSDDEYLIDLIEDGIQYHLRTAYLWERPKGNGLNDVYLLKPNKWLVILSIKEQFASIKASLRGEDVKVPTRIWDKNDLVMRITRRVSEHEYCCYEIESRSEGDYLLAMLITVATSCVLDHSEER